jgi:Ser/Thr protein kinase RdoA (MazF antagonist)
MVQGQRASSNRSTNDVDGAVLGEAAERAAWSQLTHAGQARRLRRLAIEALRQFGVLPDRLILLTHWNNATFRVWCGAEQYVLRIGRAGFQDAAAVQAEVAWLRAIRQDTALCVPEPVPARTGAFVLTVACRGVPVARPCVLFRWLDGQFRRARLRPAHYRRAGTFLAQLHTQGQQFVERGLPQGFTRKRWDVSLIFGGEPGIDRDRIVRLLSAEDIQLLNVVKDRVRRILDGLDQTPATYGLIHGDFHPSNYLFYGDDLRAIDFDECGWGHFAFDIAVALERGQRTAMYPAIREAFLAGYREVRPFPDAHCAALPALIAASKLTLAIWWAGLTDSPAHRESAPGLVARVMAEVRELMRA